MANSAKRQRRLWDTYTFPGFRPQHTVRGGRAAAVAYSLIQTCVFHDIEPFAYLADILKRLPSHQINRVSELLPFNWKKAQSEIKTA